MALTIAELNAKLVADTSQFMSAMQKAEKQASSSFDGIVKAGDKMKSVGKKLSTFVTLPIVGAAAAAFKMASSLSESLNKTDIAFGEDAKEVKKWAKELNSAFGFTQREALDAASSFQLVAKDAGLTGKQMTDLAERAADMGSVFEVSSAEAAAAIKSGLVGETEPLRRFGVVLNQAAIEAKAVAMGVAKAGEDMSVSAKQAATYALIMEETSIAQGDAAATATSAAGQMRVLKTDLGRTAEEIGTKLIPIGQKLLEKVQGLINWFSNLSSGQQEMIITVGLAVAALGPLVAIVGTVTTVVGALGKAMLFLAANPIVLIIAAVAALAAGLVIAYQRSETFRNIVDGVFQAVKRGVEIYLTPARLIIEGIGHGFMFAKDLVVSAWHTLRDIFEKIRSAADRALGPIDEILGGAAKLGGGAIKGLGGVAKGVFGGIFHDGGVVPGPRGADVPIMAEAGETVVPAGQSAGGDTFIFNVSGDTDPDGAAHRIAELLLRYQRHNGPLGFA